MEGAALWEEIAADQHGGVNIFQGTDWEGEVTGLQLLVGAITDEQRQTRQTAQATDQTTGPPVDSDPAAGYNEGKTSRETRPVLSRQEYRQVQTAQMQKYGGLDEGDIPETGYVFAHDMFYIIQNYGPGEFSVTMRLDPARDQDIVNGILEGKQYEDDEQFSSLSRQIDGQYQSDERGRNSRGADSGDRGKRSGVLRVVQKTDARPDTPGVLREGRGDRGDQVGGKFSRESVADSEAFQRWFGDSKVVDAEGKPLVVYHATNADFTVFDRGKLGEVTDNNDVDESWAQTAHIGFWFSTEKDTQQKMLSERSLPVYLNIQNPFQVGSIEGLIDYIREYANGDGADFAKWLENEGYDGIVVRDEEFGGTSYVALHPEQIKSATDNIGTFDPTNPDIRFSQEPGGYVQELRELKQENERRGFLPLVFILWAWLPPFGRRPQARLLWRSATGCYGRVGMGTPTQRTCLLLAVGPLMARGRNAAVFPPPPVPRAGRPLPLCGEPP